MNDLNDDLWWEKFGRPRTDEEIRWCRLWFEFLKISDRGAWSECVKNDFGDVDVDFDEWWPEHSCLFRHIKYLTVTEVISDRDFEFYKGSHPDILILAFPLFESKNQLRDAFETFLSKYHEGKAGRPEFIDDGDVYAFKSRPDEDLLGKVLAVYSLYAADQKKPKKDHMTLWQIEEKVSENITLIVKTGDKATLMWRKPDDHNLAARRKSQGTTVRKYLDYADQILKNVEVGGFPVYKVIK